MSYANNITQKAQLSAAAYLQAAVDAGTLTPIARDAISSGIEDGTVGLPRVVCVCKRAIAEEIFDGNWSAELTVNVIASAEDTSGAAFHSLCSEVWAHFFLAPASVEAGLSDADVEFTAFACYPRGQEWDISGDGEWLGTLTMDLKCCGSVVA